MHGRASSFHPVRWINDERQAHITLTLLCLFFLALTSSLALAQQPLLTEATDVELLASEAELRDFDSGMIVFALANGSTSSLRFIDLAERRVLKFSHQSQTLSFPTFSPDGQWISYEVGQSQGQSQGHSQGQGQQIEVSRWDGAFARPVTGTSGFFGNPSWGPAGSSLFFFTELGNGSRELARAVESPGGEFTISRLTQFGGRNTTPSASPTGTVLSYSTDRFPSGWDVCFLNLATGINSCPLGSSTQTYCRPRWAPDGESVVYSRGGGYAIDLYSYRLATNTSERLTSLTFKEYDGEFSPEGRSIAFAYNPNGGDRFELWLLRLSDRAVLPLARSVGSIRFPSWSVPRPYSLAPQDQCPTNDAKTVPGLCGCEIADTDLDNDGFPDCTDLCPQDPQKQAPGVCGCSMVDASPCSAPPTTTISDSPPAPRVIIRGGRDGRLRAFVHAQRTSVLPITFSAQTHREKTRRTRNTRRAVFLLSSTANVRFAYRPHGRLRSRWSPWINPGDRP